MALQNEMVNHTIIRSAATLFSLNINVVDWKGVSNSENDDELDVQGFNSSGQK